VIVAVALVAWTSTPSDACTSEQLGGTTADARAIVRRAPLAMPPLPATLDDPAFDNKPCLAELKRVARLDERSIDELRELATLARAAGGDCRIYVDGMLEQLAARESHHNCRGMALPRGIALWGLATIVATTKQRRAAARGSTPATPSFARPRTSVASATSASTPRARTSVHGCSISE
jgi:hypothetical protein